MDGVRVEPVVAPAPLARKGRDRHQLDRGHAELAQAAQPRHDAVERPLLAERADMQLVDHEVVERHAVPAVVAPREGAGIEDARRAVHALGLPARARVGPLLTVDGEEVVVAAEPPEPVLAVTLQLDGLVRADGYRLGARRPDAHPHRAVAHRHSSQPTHSGYSGTSQTAPSGGRVSVAENGCSCHGTGSASTPPRLPTPLPP